MRIGDIFYSCLFRPRPTSSVISSKDKCREVSLLESQAIQVWNMLQKDNTKLDFTRETKVGMQDTTTIMKRAATMEVVTLGHPPHILAIVHTIVHITMERNLGTVCILDILALMRIEDITRLNLGTDEITDM